MFTSDAYSTFLLAFSGEVHWILKDSLDALSTWTLNGQTPIQSLTGDFCIGTQMINLKYKWIYT